MVAELLMFAVGPGLVLLTIGFLVFSIMLLSLAHTLQRYSKPGEVVGEWVIAACSVVLTLILGFSAFAVFAYAFTHLPRA